MSMRSFNRAQATYDAMTPPDEPDGPECQEGDEVLVEIREGQMEWGVVEEVLEFREYRVMDQDGGEEVYAEDRLSLQNRPPVNCPDCKTDSAVVKTGNFFRCNACSLNFDRGDS